MSEPQTPPTPTSQTTQPSPSRATRFSFTVPLRDGGAFTFSPPTVVVSPASGGAAETYALADLTAAALVADPTTPAAPGAPPTPAVALRTTDARAIAFTPLAPEDCWNILEAIYRVRPQLRAPLPPPPSAASAPPPPGYAPPGYAPPGYAPPPGPGYATAYPPPPLPQSAQNNENVLAGIAHLSIFFTPLILPLVIWLTTTKSSPYASHQGKQAFIFHCIVAGVQFIVVAAVILVGFLAFGLSASSFATNSNSAAPFFSGFVLLYFAVIGFSVLINLSSVVLGVIAAVQAFQGRPYHYPLLGRF